MALFDSIFEFSDAQTLIASSAAVTASTDVVDLGSDMKDGFGTAVTTQKLAGYGKPLVVVLTIATTMVGGIVTAQLTSKASSASISSGGTSHGTFALEDETAGYQATIAIPTDDMARYLGIIYTVSSGAITAGAIDAYVAVAEQIID